MTFGSWRGFFVTSASWTFFPCSLFTLRINHFRSWVILSLFLGDPFLLFDYIFFILGLHPLRVSGVFLFYNGCSLPVLPLLRSGTSFATSCCVLAPLLFRVRRPWHACATVVVRLVWRPPYACVTAVVHTGECWKGERSVWGMLQDFRLKSVPQHGNWVAFTA